MLEVECAPDVLAEPFDGRVLVYFSKHEPEPRTAANPARLEPVLSAEVRALAPGQALRLDVDGAQAFPAPLRELEGGRYWVQAVLDTDPEAPWPGRAAGNPCSAPVRVELADGAAPRVRLVCDRRIAASPPSKTEFVRVVDVPSEALSAFHGRPVRLRALVHLPEAWAREPERRFPAFWYLSGFGASLDGFESVDWPAAPIGGEPYVVVYPDPSCSSGHSGFVDGDNNGPWGTAFAEELVPAVSRRFRCLEDREARIVAGHSSGGWAALALMVRRPRLFGSAWASSPDPVDFRDFMGVDLYAPDANLLFDAPGRPRPFCKLGSWTVNYTVEHARREEVLRGGVLAYFEALFGPRGPDGEPRPLFDRQTGAVDAETVAHWSRYDLSAELRARWDELAPLVDGRLVVTVGDKDNFLLHGSVDLLRDGLEGLGADVGIHELSGDHFSELDGVHSVEQVERVVERFRAWREQTEVPTHAPRVRSH